MTNLKAPTPVGPYSMFRYLENDSSWIMAGSIPIDPLSGKLNNDTVEDEVNQVFDNIEAVLAENEKTVANNGYKSCRFAPRFIAKLCG